MFGRNCKECGKPSRNMDYCDKHFDKDKMIEIFKKSCNKHLEQIEAKKHHKKNVIESIFDEMHRVYTKLIRPR
jgi:hypothetical protein